MNPTFKDNFKTQLDDVIVEGELCIPESASALVIFASSRRSARFGSSFNFVCKQLEADGVGTLLVDLLTQREEDELPIHAKTNLLARRLVHVNRLAMRHPRVAGLAIGYFGEGTGGAAAMEAGVSLKSTIKAIVAQGARTDVVHSVLSKLQASTLLIVGERQYDLLPQCWSAYQQLGYAKEFEVIPQASENFEEPGALQHVAELACNWFGEHLVGSRQANEVRG